MNIMTPVIHMNGSHAASLEQEYMAAYEAAGDLLDKLKAIDLNARDYYVRPELNAFESARMQSIDRAEAVYNIRNELETIILAIQNQQ